ncbi:unnamed protein product, partial [Adineta ricciae]
GDVELSSMEMEVIIVVLFIFITFLPVVIVALSALLSIITKKVFFSNLTNWWMELFSRGIIEQIFISAIEYLHTNRHFESKISKHQRVYKINKKMIPTQNAQRIRNFTVILYPIQAFIVSLVIFEKLFTQQRSSETCESYQKLFSNDSFYDTACSVRSLAAHISANELFNPINAFQSMTLSPLFANVSEYCEQSNATTYETSARKSIIQ